MEAFMEFVVEWGKVYGAWIEKPLRAFLRAADMPGADTFSLPAAPPNVDYRTLPPPPAQPTMPGDLMMPPEGPATAPVFPDLTSIDVPPAP